MRIVYQNKIIDIDTKHVLGSGGEANVVKYNNNIAFKIYHDPTLERAQKLQAFLKCGFSLPPNVLAPIDVVTDTAGKINGFAMAIAPRTVSFIDLSNIKYRNQHQITTNDVIQIFSNSKLLLDAINSSNVIVGDLNDVNKLFVENDSSVYYIDVDSFQFGRYPCFVGTDSFIDPTLYGVDLTRKPSFTIESDWYAFAVMLFKSLLFVHPYGGTHKTFNTMIRRAQKKVWVLEKEVVYPKIALHPETLSDDLLHYFSNIFCKGERSNLPVQSLQELIGTFNKCASCNTYFSKTRSKCPQCQKTAPQQVVDLTSIISPKHIDREKCDIIMIYETKGVILFSKVINDKIIIISYEDGETRFVSITEKFKQSFLLWKGIEPQFKYDYFLPSCLVINQDSDLLIMDVKDSNVVLIAKLTTLSFHNEPVFSCSSNYLYRLTTNMIMKGQYTNGQVIEEEVTAAMENQTWLQVGKNDFGLGMFQIFNQHKYFVFSAIGRYEIEMDELKGQIIDIDVCMSIDNVILLRKSLYNGRTYSHWHIINDKAKILEKKTEESINSDLLKNIHGKQLVGSAIIHPTDAGIVIERHGSLSLKSSTAEFVNSDQSLQIYKQGLLAISTNKICYLTLTQSK